MEDGKPSMKTTNHGCPYLSVMAERGGRAVGEEGIWGKRSKGKEVKFF
jgi:hypothetical protein